MAQEREQPIVRLHAHHPRHRAERLHELGQLRERRAASVARLYASRYRCGQQPGSPAEQIGPRVLEPALRRARERVAADEREARRQRAGGRHDAALRAAGVGDDGRLADVLVQIREQRDVGPHRRGEDDEVRFREDDEVVGRHVDRVQPHRRFEHVLVVDADDERLRPELACRQRDGSTDEPEAHDADFVENRRLPLRVLSTRLDDGELLHCRFQIGTLLCL